MYAVQKRLVAFGFTSRCAVPVLCDRAVAVGAALRLPFGGDDAIDQALRRIDLGAWHKDFHVVIPHSLLSCRGAHLGVAWSGTPQPKVLELGQGRPLRALTRVAMVKKVSSNQRDCHSRQNCVD